MTQEADFRLQEFRNIADASLDLDRRIVQLFVTALIVAGSIVGVLVNAMFGPNAKVPTLPLAYLSLLPSLLLAGVFAFQVTLRRDMAKLGAYRLVFFEQDDATRLSWERALAVFRADRRWGETNDPIPYAYWVVVTLGLGLFFAAIGAAGAALRDHMLPALVPIWAMLWVQMQWKTVYGGTRNDMARFIEAWQRAKRDLTSASA